MDLSINFSDRFTLSEIMERFIPANDISLNAKSKFDIKKDKSFLLVNLFYVTPDNIQIQRLFTLQIEALTGKYKFYNPKDLTKQERNSFFLSLYESIIFTQKEIAILLGVSQTTTSIMKRDLIKITSGSLF